MSQRLDLDSITVHRGSRYPAPFDQPCRDRQRQRLGEAAGLSDFGVNLLRLPPGAWSSQRHWHSTEDEFVWVLAGRVVLITDRGEQDLDAGDCVGFKAGVREGHHLVNRSASDAVLLEIGSRKRQDAVEYSAIDMRISNEDSIFRHKDGEPYPSR